MELWNTKISTIVPVPNNVIEEIELIRKNELKGAFESDRIRYLAEHGYNKRVFEYIACTFLLF